MKLHDYAVSHGIPDMVPAFAQELHSTTERFLMLAKKPTESGGGDDSRGESTGRESGVSEKAAVKQPEKTSEQDVGEAQPAAMGSSVWGYNFGTQAEIGPDLTVLDPSLPPDAQPSMTPAPLGYEVITMPTLENASFPFDPNAPAYFLAQGAPGAPGATPPIHPSATPNITQPSFSPSIPACLPLPTMAFTETTFGRRLQRSTIELACQLSTMPNPPNDFFARVFGFCMLYEPIENIRVRLHKALEKTSQESLHNWRVPFWAVGGAGQHQFGGSSQQQQEEPQQGNPVGNQGTADVAKHAFGTNFGVGPFDARTTDTRDRQLDASMRIMLPGFQGDFFDPDDVEVYLQSRGVSIEPGQDYVTAEVDLSWFGGEEHGQEQQQAQAQATAMYYDQWAADTPPPPMPPQAAVEETRSGEGVFGATQPVADLLGLGGSTHPLLANTKRIVTLNVDVLIRGEPLHFVSLALSHCQDRYTHTGSQNSSTMASVSEGHPLIAQSMSTRHSGLPREATAPCSCECADACVMST